MAAFSQSQVYFEENKGQYDSSVLYQASVAESQIRFLADGISIATIRELEGEESSSPGQAYKPKLGYLGEVEPEYEALVWNFRFIQASPHVQVTAYDKRPGYVHYLKTSNPANWARYVSRYSAVRYENLYEGIDLLYYGTSDNGLKYDFVVQPTADVSQVRLAVEGGLNVEINEQGELEIHTLWGVVADAAPYTYQLINGQEIPVESSYRLYGPNEVGFEIIGSYRPEYPLIIDPLILNWSTFIHSSTSDDYAMAVDLDEANNVYVAGYTKSLQFPTTPGVFQYQYGGGLDLYLVKLSPGGSTLEFATYLGGQDWELVYGMEVNAAGEAFLGGFTRSEDFPVTADAYQPVSRGGLVESFALRLSASGDELVYGTFLGGTDRDYTYDLALAADNSLFLTGFTLSDDFPTTAGAYSQVQMGNGDVFVAKLNPQGNQLIYSTLVGGSEYEMAQSMVINEAGEAFVTGNTGSDDFPVTEGVLQTEFRLNPSLIPEDAFVFRLNATGTQLQYATYLGGQSGDGGYAICINDDDGAYITGITYSEDFPTTADAYMHAYEGELGNGEVFVAHLNADASAAYYCTYLGGNEIEFSKAIALDEFGRAHVLGATRSMNFPLVDAEATYQGMYDLFVSVLSREGSRLVHSSLLGGTLNEYPRASGALHIQDGVMTLAATSHSENMPMTAGGYQPQKTNGTSDCPLVMNIEVGVVLDAAAETLHASWDEAAQAVQLHWQPQGRQQGFWVIERKQVDGSWHPVSTAHFEGKAQIRHTDPEAARFRNQHLIYRLIYVDVNGTISYGKLVEVWIPPQPKLEVHISPNPARDFLNIEVRGYGVEAWHLEVLDASGRQLYLSPTYHSPTPYLQHREVMNTSPLAKAMYYLVVYGPGEPVVKRFVVQR